MGQGNGSTIIPEKHGTKVLNGDNLKINEYTIKQTKIGNGVGLCISKGDKTIDVSLDAIWETGVIARELNDEKYTE